MGKIKNWVVFGLLLAIPIFLLVQPANFFDFGAPICPSKIIFKLDCWGCGLTRAVQHFIHFDVESAVYYHRGIWFIFPFLVYFWFKMIQNSGKSIYLFDLKKNKKG
jgi:hypothetical protein